MCRKIQSMAMLKGWCKNTSQPCDSRQMLSGDDRRNVGSGGLEHQCNEEQHLTGCPVYSSAAQRLPQSSVIDVVENGLDVEECHLQRTVKSSV